MGFVSLTVICHVVGDSVSGDVSLRAIDGDRCAVSLERAAEIRAIWRAALGAAGASNVEIRQGGLDSSETTTGKESTNAQTIQSE